MASLPSVFLSHGSPMHALDPGAAGEAWRSLGRRLPKPRTIHDFSGFPEPLYRLRYPALGAPEVAQRAQSLLKAQGLTAAIDGCRGLDHGAWAPLLYVYPDANVPVVQISVQPALGTRHHLRLGRALRPLADEEVLLVGSGHMTHNLRDWARDTGKADPYAREFRDWVKEKMEKGDLEALADYRSLAPHAARAHPTDEHFLPLFFALGASANQAKPERIYDGIESGVLAMDSYLFH